MTRDLILKREDDFEAVGGAADMVFDSIERVFEM